MTRPDPRCHINHKEKYIFINISKNASTSIRNTIKFDIFTDYDTISNPEEYMKFIVIRNPIYRAISSFFEVRKARRDGPWEVTEKSNWFKESDLEKSFSMFLDFIKDNYYDSHVIPQINFLNDKGLTLDDINFVLLHDNIADDFLRLRETPTKIVFTKEQLPKLQTSENKGKVFLTDSVSKDQKIQQKIQDLYPIDMELYNNLKNKDIDERFNRLHNNL